MQLFFVLHPHRDGWRWAIHLTDPPTVLGPSIASCVNAGAEPSKRDADERGQQCLYTLMSYCRRTLQPLKITTMEFDADIVPDGEPHLVDGPGGLQAV